MGLPVSFHTNKEKRNRTVKGKRKDGKKKSLSSCEITQDEVLTSIQELKEECESIGTLHGNSNKDSSCLSLLGQSEFSSFYTGDGDFHCLDGGKEGLNNLNADSAHTSLECIACNQQSGLSLDNTTDNVSISEKVQLEKDVGVMVGSSLECGNHAESCPINSNVDSRWISGETLNGHCEGNPLNGEQIEYACMECSLSGEQVESIAMQTAEHHTEDGLLCNVVGEELNNCNATNNNCEGTTNDWRFYWDNDYQRNYFYNTVTTQCTWDPPPGMDDLIFTSFTTKQPETALEMELDEADLEESNDLQTSASLPSELDIADGFIEDDVLLDRQLNESEGAGQFADNLCTLSSTKQKKRVRKTKSKWKLPTEAQELEFCNTNEEISPSLNKYWCQRYLLFNKYDDGIKMDGEGWFSVTPEAIAKHHALRCGSGTIVDFFTGVGGNSIQFAMRSKHVIAIDIDPKRIDLAQYNAAIYGVCDQIDFIRGDSFVLAPNLKADVVFMSPPWGGPDYLKERTFDMKTMLRPHDGNFLFSIGRGIASKVVMFLPRNVDINELAELSLSANPPWLLEVEKNYLNGKLKAITAYFCKPS
uniref:Trimethylguanosine synthase n=2 Tax=Solanum tuberosum TaxID=4113 RepID=M1B8Z0_SOLTU